MDDEPKYSRADRLNAGFCLLLAALIAGVAADVLFDLTGRWKGRTLARQTEASLAASSHD